MKKEIDWNMKGLSYVFTSTGKRDALHLVRVESLQISQTFQHQRIGADRQEYRRSTVN